MVITENTNTIWFLISKQQKYSKQKLFRPIIQCSYLGSAM